MYSRPSYGNWANSVTIKLRHRSIGGGGGPEIQQFHLFHFLFAELIFFTLCLKQNIYSSLCVEIHIDFIFLECFSVYKVVFKLGLVLI